MNGLNLLRMILIYLQGDSVPYEEIQPGHNVGNQWNSV
jgi:hypothetical protein